MKNTFKPGDRIAIYNSFPDIGWKRLVGTIEYSNCYSGYVQVKTDDGVMGRGFHYKQCRRLKVKKKRREWSGRWDTVKSYDTDTIVFVPEDDNSDLMPLLTTKSTLREVRKSK